MESHFDSSNYADISVMQNNDQDQDETSTAGLADQSKRLYREQDIYLPIANIARIMKTAIPSNGKIAKEAKECVQECVSEFISFITSEASERCAQEKRKTINGEDVLFAMSALGFDPYIAPLKVYLQKYRDLLMMHPCMLKHTSRSAQILTRVEVIKTLKAEKTGNYVEGAESNPINEADLVDPFAPSQFSDILVATENSAVFSNQTSNLDHHIQFS